MYKPRVITAHLQYLKLSFNDLLWICLSLAKIKALLFRTQNQRNSTTEVMLLYLCTVWWIILDPKYIYSLVLVKAIGHSSKTRFSPPQSLGHPSEESTSHFCEFVVVKQTWSKTPSLSQSILWYWALSWLQPLGLLQLLPGVTELSGISVTKKVKKSLGKLILIYHWLDMNPGIDLMITIVF